MVVDNNCVMTLWNIQIWTDKQVMSNQLDVVVVDKVDMQAVLTDAATPNDSNIRKNETGTAGDNVKSEVINDPLGLRSTWSCEPQAEEWL